MAASPQAEYTQEVRFAVVMYGGVSLAIYINGIAQELLRMVRSTSPSWDNGTGNHSPIPSQALAGKTEHVYRRLSCLLSDPQLLANFCESLENDNPPSVPDIVDKRMAEGKVHTRFVVDILSGTSAGGINAIYLAKALANDQKLDELKTLWVTEGDIGLLINDKKSVAGLHLTNQKPPQSLLNSRRMYFKLLKALHGMEETRQSSKEFISPHVGELDLFITTTDIEGLLLPLRLCDTVVYERRHRNVFHFKYESAEATGAERNDFLGKNDPFLAFAARCTSSFPFAFEPMRLCDIDEILNRFPEYHDKEARRASVAEWLPFFKENCDPLTRKPVDFFERSYGDGGYLDNKPFTYATETLTRRDAPLVVDRKLIYIEPSPEHPEDEPPRTEKYQALENVKAALLDLPTYETIREDVQRLLARNELIKRVNRITRAIERDFDKPNVPRPTLEDGEWATLDLAGMASRFGIYYIPYRRLRISSTTDELAKLVARSIDLDPQSAQFVVVRHLIHAWREVAYPDYHEETNEESGADAKEGEQKTRPTANQFLIDFDFKYWLRRITFVRGKIDQLYRLVRLPARDEDGNGVNTWKISADDAAVLDRLKQLKYHPLDYSALTADEKNKIQDVLAYLKCELNEMYKKLRLGGRLIQSKPDENSSEAHKKFAAALEEIKRSSALDSVEIDYLLGLPRRPQQAPAADGQRRAPTTREEFSRLDDNELMRRATRHLFRKSQRLILATSGEKRKLIPTDLGKSLNQAGAALSIMFHEYISDDTWKRGKALLKTTEELPEPSDRCRSLRFESPHRDSIREYLWRYFSRFDDFDQISFPILFGTDVGETAVVDVLRISPEDATTLIDERAERNKANGRQKLAGTALHHFGAFLDQVWRQNDILWGRLDGAERLITAMLPDPENKKVREKLINEAHSTILVEELTQESRDALHLLLTDALIKISSGLSTKTAVAQVTQHLNDETLRTRLNTVMRAGLENETLLSFIKSSYEVNRDLDPKIVLRSVARSTQVIGKMFEDMADQHQLEGKRLAWIARLGQFFWGLVEVAVPGSLMNLLFFHWLKILYAFELFLIVGSILLNAEKSITNFGWTALGLTAALNVIVLLLGDYIRGRGRWWRALALLIFLGVILFAALGMSDVFGWGWKAGLGSGLNGVKTWLTSVWS